jgi:hypothetical protein
MRRVARSAVGLPVAAFLMLASVAPGLGVLLFGPGSIVEGSAVRLINEGVVCAVIGYMIFRKWRGFRDWRAARGVPSVRALVVAEIAAPVVTLAVVLAARAAIGFPGLDLIYWGLVVIGLGAITLAGARNSGGPSG